MALVLITGVPGTGKTLYAIQKYIIPQLRKGSPVYTNIDGLIERRIAAIFKIDIFDVEKNLRILKQPEYFFNEVRDVQNAYVVLDEVQNLFANRDWQKSANGECINYLMEHRHYGHSLVFITPHIDSVDAGIRRVAQFTYKHKSFSALGNNTTVKCAVFDQCNVNKSPVQFFTWHHDTRVYDCYSSYFKENTKEEKVRVYPLKNAVLFGLIAIVVICGFFAIKNSGKFFNKIDQLEKPNKGKNVSVVQEKSFRRFIVVSGDTIQH